MVTITEYSIIGTFIHREKKKKGTERKTALEAHEKKVAHKALSTTRVTES